MNDTPQAGVAERTILVHKADTEGALRINALTGVIVSPIDERPEWAEGLTCALLAERHGFYTKRLGPDYTASHKMPDGLPYEDLGWIGVDAEGEPVELEADLEYRMTVVADVLGINRPADLSNMPHDDTRGELGHVLLDMDTGRSIGEATALDRALLSEFDDAAGSGTDKAAAGGN